jgi:ABC-2 type transport system ATP-binding protein
VETLLTVRDVTQIRAKGLDEAAQKEIKEVIQRHNGELISAGNPTTTLEELFLKIIEESEARPGRRVRGSGDDKGGGGNGH